MKQNHGLFSKSTFEIIVYFTFTLSYLLKKYLNRLNTWQLFNAMRVRALDGKDNLFPYVARQSRN